MEAGYLVVRDFAGVRNGRASSAMSFGDANRAAMKACVELDCKVSVFSKAGEFIVSYVVGPSGKALLGKVGDVAEYEGSL